MEEKRKLLRGQRGEGESCRNHAAHVEPPLITPVQFLVAAQVKSVQVQTQSVHPGRLNCPDVKKPPKEGRPDLT